MRKIILGLGILMVMVLAGCNFNFMGLGAPSFVGTWKAAQDGIESYYVIEKTGGADTYAVRHYVLSEREANDIERLFGRKGMKKESACWPELMTYKDGALSTPGSTLTMKDGKSEVLIDIELLEHQRVSEAALSWADIDSGRGYPEPAM